MACLSFSLYLGRFYVTLGFALKPYMVVALVSGVVFARHIKYDRLFTFERLMFCFIVAYSLSALNLTFPAAHLRFLLGIIVIVAFYTVARGLIKNCSVQQLGSILSFSALVGSIGSLFYYLAGFFKSNFNFRGTNVSYFGLLIDRGFPRLTGLSSEDPNIFAFFVTLGFFYLLNNFKPRVNRWAFLLITFSILATFSRGAYIGIGAGLVVYFFAIRDFRTKAKFLLVGISLLVLAISLFSFIGIDVINIMVNRFADVVNGGGGIRRVLWANAWETFIENPVFGVGIHASLDYTAARYGTVNYVHNTPLEVLAESGLVGFSFYVLFWISIIISCVKVARNDQSARFLLGAAVAMFVQMLFLSILLNEAFYFLLVVLYRYMREQRGARMVQDS